MDDIRVVDVATHFVAHTPAMRYIATGATPEEARANLLASIPDDAIEDPIPRQGQTKNYSRPGMTREQKDTVFERDGYQCQACGSMENLTIDHIVPISRGGSSGKRNLQVLCKGCNGAKGDSLEPLDRLRERFQVR